MIVRWGLEALPGVLDELAVSRPLLITTHGGGMLTCRCLTASTARDRMPRSRAWPELTLSLPVRESAGSAMNALAHCAEALYTADRTAATDSAAVAGAPLISRWLPVVASPGHDLDLEARRRLLGLRIIPPCRRRRG